MGSQTYSKAVSIPRQDATSLASGRGVAILIVLCLVQFMDVLDASIRNIALRSIKRDLGFSEEGLRCEQAAVA